MWKYEDFEGMPTLTELIEDLQEDGFHFDFYPETETECGCFIATKESSRVEIEFGYDRIFNINSNIWIPEYDDSDIPEYDDFDAIHDGSYLPD